MVWIICDSYPSARIAPCLSYIDLKCRFATYRGRKVGKRTIAVKLSILSILDVSIVPNVLADTRVDQCPMQQMQGVWY